MAAFCACCGTEISAKSGPCPACGTPQHGMLPPNMPVTLDAAPDLHSEDLTASRDPRSRQSCKWR